MTRFYAMTAAAFLALLVGGLAVVVLLRGREDEFAQCRASTVAGGGSIGGPFSLIDGEGRRVSEADVLTKPSLVYFGYTFCPDVCPFDMARNAEATDLLEREGIEVTPVFITVDPERDTPEVVRDWAGAMHPRAIGLSGSAEEIRKAAQAYRVYYRAADHAEGEEFYPVDHSAFTYLMLPGHGFAELYRRETTAEEIAKSVACFTAAI